MKARDFKACAACGRKIGETGALTFFRLGVERLILRTDAIRRQSGLELALASPALAAAMGPDPVLAQTVAATPPLLICEPCAIAPDGINLFNLWAEYADTEERTTP